MPRPVPAAGQPSCDPLTQTVTRGYDYTVSRDFTFNCLSLGRRPVAAAVPGIAHSATLGFTLTTVCQISSEFPVLSLCLTLLSVQTNCVSTAVLHQPTVFLINASADAEFARRNFYITNSRNINKSAIFEMLPTDDDDWTGSKELWKEEESQFCEKVREG